MPVSFTGIFTYTVFDTDEDIRTNSFALGICIAFMLLMQRE
jgi:hypothetical protein